jgi:hypothetical protein
MRRLPIFVVSLVVAASVALLGASVSTAAPIAAVVDGPALNGPAEAPWSVLTNQTDGHDLGQCSGSIIDAEHVVTAAHCAFDETTGAAWPLSGFHVYAGISHTGVNPEEQSRTVTAIRIGPDYDPAFIGVGADVAELTVNEPFDLSGAGVQPIGIAADGALPAGGTAGRIVGWGQIEVGRADGHEHELVQDILRQRECLGGWASRFCGSTSSGATCSGDSGAGLTAGSPPALIGVLSIGIGEPSCAPGARTGYVSVASPEVALWLRGDEDPPRAPRTEGRASIGGGSLVGEGLSCHAPRWEDASALSSVFFRVDTGEDLQHGPADYSLRPSDIGHEVACASIAEGPGGTTESPSSNTVPVSRTPIPAAQTGPPAPKRKASEELVAVLSRRFKRGHWQVKLRLSGMAGRIIQARWIGSACVRTCRIAEALRTRGHLELQSPPTPRNFPMRLVLWLPTTTIEGIEYLASHRVVFLRR